MELLDSDGAPVETVTSENGFHFLLDLEAGDYTVQNTLQWTGIHPVEKRDKW